MTDFCDIESLFHNLNGTKVPYISVKKTHLGPELTHFQQLTAEGRSLCLNRQGRKV